MFVKKVLAILFVFMLSNSYSYASTYNNIKPITCSVSDATVAAVEEYLKLDFDHSSDLRSQIISALKKDTCLSSKLSDSYIEMLAVRISEDVINFGLTVSEVIEEFFYE